MSGYGRGANRLQCNEDEVIDLRSDTVTTPTKEMRQAMANAKVGDDVFGDDPTVIHLEKRAAEIFDKESAIFMPSGSMGNLASAMSHCTLRDSEMIVGNLQHTFLYEQGGMATLAGIHANVIPNAQDGTIPINKIEAAIRGDDPHLPVTRLISVENTHNNCGGVPLPMEYMNDVSALANQHKIPLHIDGARIFNAATALNTSVAHISKGADSVSFCLSKGLGAPAGSVVVGQKDFIGRCRRARKALGGTMRQVGVLAAAGLIGMEVISKKLAQDHALAKTLATGINQLPQMNVNLEKVQTNIVFFDVADKKGSIVSEKLQAEHNILLVPYDDTTVRAVLHHQITPQAIDRVLKSITSVVESVF